MKRNRENYILSDDILCNKSDKNIINHTNKIRKLSDNLSSDDELYDIFKNASDNECNHNHNHNMEMINDETYDIFGNKSDNECNNNIEIMDDECDDNIEIMDDGSLSGSSSELDSSNESGEGLDSTDESSDDSDLSRHTSDDEFIDDSKINDNYNDENIYYEDGDNLAMVNMIAICPNPLCDHKVGGTYTKITDLNEFRDIDDLIKLGKTYHCKENKEYNGLNLEILCKLVNPLSKLKSLVGMSDVKINIINQIVFFLQELNIKKRCGTCLSCIFNLECKIISNPDMLHTVITGPPGVGKTELGKILGQIYNGMGILSKNTFHIATRSDLVAGFLGQTAIKTQKFIDKCEGGVMFIDEVYSLGSEVGRDSFSKEAIDTINQNLTERRDFLCIIAGYEDQIQKCFFNQNEGLARRFPFRYHISGYTPSELLHIFMLKIKSEEWGIDASNSALEQLEQLFKQNKDKFPHYGGDIETLFLNCKICHSLRVLFKDVSLRKILIFDDIKEGLKMYSSHKKIMNENDTIPFGIYN
jgi:hypothetical protein